MEIEDLEELGRQNQRMIDLLTRHCRNARVEQSPLMGVGMVEVMSGLPISGREIHCPHAAQQTSVGMQFERTAVEFYRGNCVGCPHRQPIGVPNLKTHVASLDKAAAEEAAQHARESAAREAERAARSRRRAELLANEPEPTREWIGLLDAIDVEEPDEDAAGRFLDIARGGPELCTTPAARALHETGIAIANRTLVVATDVLHQAGCVADDDALAVAVHALERGPLSGALPLVERLQGRLKPDALKPTLPSIIRLASPYRDFPGASAPAEVGGLRVAVEVDLPALLDQLIAMIGSESKWDRASGSGAAAELIMLEPGTTELLAPALIDSLRLPGALEIYMESSRGNVSRALETALLTRPQAMAKLYLEKGRQLEKEARNALYHAFDSVIRNRMREHVPEPAGSVAVEPSYPRGRHSG